VKIVATEVTINKDTGTIYYLKLEIPSRSRVVDRALAALSLEASRHQSGCRVAS